MFSLFGDKPLTDMLIFMGKESDLAALSEDEIIAATFTDASIREDWKTWKCIAHQIPSKSFVFVERSCPQDHDLVFYCVMNVKQTKKILLVYRKVFEEKTGISVDPDKMIQEFKNPESSFWRRVFADHYLSGLLYGFGEENVAYFLTHQSFDEEKSFSDEPDNFATSIKFPIPIYAMSVDDKTAPRYRDQRKIIQNIFRNKEIVDVTIQKLLD